MYNNLLRCVTINGIVYVSCIDLIHNFERVKVKNELTEQTDNLVNTFINHMNKLIIENSQR